MDLLDVVIITLDIVKNEYTLRDINQNKERKRQE